MEYVKLVIVQINIPAARMWRLVWGRWLSTWDCGVFVVWLLFYVVSGGVFDVERNVR